MNDTDIHSLVGAYALDAVDDLERARFGRHLAECEACALDVAELQAAAGRLADLTIEEPPGRLRSAVLAQVAHTRQVGPRQRRSEDGGAARWRRWTAAAVTVGIVAIGAATGTYVVEEQRIQQYAQAQQIATVLAAKDAVVRTSDVQGGRVTVVLSESLDEGVAVLSALPGPGADQAYQLWVIKGDNPPDSKGLFAAGTGSGTTLFTGIRGANAMAVSREPAHGSPAPTNVITRMSVT